MTAELKERLQKEAITIGIIGNIGSGKSTLAYLLSERLEVAHVEEKIENPFLDDFYTDPARYSFDMEFNFLLEKAIFLRDLDPTKSKILDPCFEMDFIYTLAQQKMGYMDSREGILYGRAAKVLKEEFGIKDPDVILRLHAPIRVLRQRIEKRNRSYEAGLLENPPRYLQVLDGAIDDFVAKDRSGRILFVDVSKDNFADELHMSGLEAQIKRKI